MALPQRDSDIEQIHRFEGLIAYAEAKARPSARSRSGCTRRSRWKREFE